MALLCIVNLRASQRTLQTQHKFTYLGWYLSRIQRVYLPLQSCLEHRGSLLIVYKNGPVALLSLAARLRKSDAPTWLRRSPERDSASGSCVPSGYIKYRHSVGTHHPPLSRDQRGLGDPPRGSRRRSAPRRLDSASTTMATSRPSTPSNLVQVHTYRHLAPAYAAAPSQGSGVPQPVASSTLNNHSNTAAVRPFTPLEVRQLVLEYLAHEGYVDSAIAFASEMVTEDPDADASAASGEEEESHASPARTGSNTLAAAGGSNHSTVTDGEAMQEDVEATTDDETTSRRDGAAAAAAAEMRIGAADSPVINGNGKNVAFLDEGEGVAGANGTVKPSALSEEEVQDLRLRKSESSGAHSLPPMRGLTSSLHVKSNSRRHRDRSNRSSRRLVERALSERPRSPSSSSSSINRRRRLNCFRQLKIGLCATTRRLQIKYSELVHPSDFFRRAESNSCSSSPSRISGPAPTSIFILPVSLYLRRHGRAVRLVGVIPRTRDHQSQSPDSDVYRADADGSCHFGHLDPFDSDFVRTWRTHRRRRRRRGCSLVRRRNVCIDFVPRRFGVNPQRRNRPVSSLEGKSPPTPSGERPRGLGTRVYRRLWTVGVQGPGDLSRQGLLVPVSARHPRRDGQLGHPA
jgi:hypothetical protein